MVQKIFTSRLCSYTSALVLAMGLSACKVQVGGSGYSGYPSYGNTWNNNHYHQNNNNYYGDRQHQRPRPGRPGRPNRPNRPDRPTDTRPDRPNRPNRPPTGQRPNRPRPERNEQAQLSQKVQLATLKLNKVSLYKNDTKVAFVRNTQSGDVQMQLKYVDSKSQKNILAAYNLKDLEIDDSKNPEQIKVGFCAGAKCADNTASANAWKLVVDRKTKRSLLEDQQGRQVYLDGKDSARVLGVTESIVNEMKEYGI